MNKVEFEDIEEIIKGSGVRKIIFDDAVSGGSLIVSDVPQIWHDDFYACGFYEYACFCDYWIDRLDPFGNQFNSYDFLLSNECSAASEISVACRGQSRGFEGETQDWFIQWLLGENEGQKVVHCKNAAILTHRINNQIAGISCTATYAHYSEKGAVVWVRMLAVHPKYQRCGIGNNLLMQTLQYGVEHGAKRAFLHVDIQNTTAIKIYTAAGFLRREGDGQADMIWRKN